MKMYQKMPAQKGLGLVELMVALAIVSFLALIMIMIFLSGRASFFTQDQVGRLQENGRYAFHLVTQELQVAGFRRDVWDPPAFGFSLTANTQDGGANAAPDVIEVQYESKRNCFNVDNPVTEDVIRPDTGATMTVPQFHLKVTQFSVVNNQLLYTCSYGPAAGPLVQQVSNPVADGIENLQVQYGEDLTGDFSVNQWVDGGNWNALQNVVSARVALVVRTPEQFTIEADNETFDLYGTTTAAVGDQRLRNVFSGQVSLRNQTL